MALKGQGLLVLGASGRGKSGLALSLMVMGAKLVADDRVALTRVGQSIIASAPDNISGLIEARGIGLLKAATCGPVPLAFVVDLNQTEAERMPPIRQMDLLGVSLGLFFKVDAPHFAAALIQMMKEGRHPEP
ncbi:MAG: serine kinase [Rhodobacteraceae bacterium]|nr:serine kinase [Paracoccaceae bacterium]